MFRAGNKFDLIEKANFMVINATSRYIIFYEDFFPLSKYLIVNVEKADIVKKNRFILPNMVIYTDNINVKISTQGMNVQDT